MLAATLVSKVHLQPMVICDNADANFHQQKTEMYKQDELTGKTEYLTLRVFQYNQI